MHKLTTGKFLIILIAVLYLLTLRGNFGNFYPVDNKILNKPPFETSQERGRYAQIISLAEDHTPTVDKFYTYLKPDLAWYNGHFFPAFPIGISVLAVPLYIIGKALGMAQIFTFSISAIFSILCAFLIYKISRKIGYSARTAAFTTIVFTLATVVWTYSSTLSTHPLSALLVLISLYMYLRLDISKTNQLEFAVLGLCLGFNFFIDYPNLVILLPIFIMSALKITNFKMTGHSKSQKLNMRIPVELAIAFFTILLPIMLFVSYNRTYYGTNFALSNTYNIKFLEIRGLINNYDDLSNDVFTDYNYSKKFSLDKTLNGLNVLFTSTDRGLLVFFPILFLAFPGFFYLYKRNKSLAIVCLLTILVNALIYGSYDDPWGGWSFGSRYMIASLPLFALLCGAGFEYLTHKQKHYIILILALLYLSMAVALLGALTTSAVPPSIEIQGTGVHQNYFYNIEYLIDHGVSAFIYNTLFSSFLNPIIYYVFAYLVAISGATYVLRKSSHHNV